MTSKIKLQPLRLSTGWEIHWNKFYEIDPPEIITDIYRQYFDEDMIYLTYYSQYASKKVGIDLGWGNSNSDGNYVLHLLLFDEIKISDKAKQTLILKRNGNTFKYVLENNFENRKNNWDSPLLITRDRIEVVEKLEEIISDISENQQSQFWKYLL